MGRDCFKNDLDTGFKWKLANDRDVDPRKMSDAWPILAMGLREIVIVEAS